MLALQGESGCACLNFRLFFARRLLQLPEEVFCFWNEDFSAAYADEFFV